jgi:hypothetical protein
MQDYPRTQELERFHNVTWRELAELDPQLDRLLWEARTAGAACRDWSNVGRVFAPFRNSLSRLVGFTSVHRRHRVLGSLGAYEVAYWKLYAAIVGLLPLPHRREPKKTSRAKAAFLADGFVGMHVEEMARLTMR